MKKKKTKEITIHEVAIALCERRNVWFNNHTVRLVHIEYCDNPCQICEMDSICDMDMVDLCGECSAIIKKPCFLKLVTNDAHKSMKG